VRLGRMAYLLVAISNRASARCKPSLNQSARYLRRDDFGNVPFRV
jgi:hypothetical protein